MQIYPALKNRSQGNFLGDTWYMCLDFGALMDRALAEYPMYKRIVEYKMERVPNIEIRDLLQKEFAFTHSIEYISSLDKELLWR